LKRAFIRWNQLVRWNDKAGVTFTHSWWLAMTFLGAAAMPTTKECRHNAEICLMLASETEQIYAKMALIELATEFRILAEDLERRPRGQ
jgi:hypothetical protein